MKRWPIILTGVIDTIYRIDHELGLKLSQDGAAANNRAITEKIEQGKVIIGQIGQLKYEMARDRPLGCVTLAFPCLIDPEIAVIRPIPDDGEPYVDEYNVELAILAKDGRNTWFTAPWLFAEYVTRCSFAAQLTSWASDQVLPVPHPQNLLRLRISLGHIRPFLHAEGRNFQEQWKSHLSCVTVHHGDALY